MVPESGRENLAAMARRTEFERQPRESHTGNMNGSGERVCLGA